MSRPTEPNPTPGGAPPTACPFCGQDLGPLFEGFATQDTPVQCIRCLAAVLLTARPEDREHPARLAAALLEYSPPDTACTLELRAGSRGASGAEPGPQLLAAWNVEEYVPPLLAGRILDLQRVEVERLAAGGALGDAVQGRPPRNAYERAQWLIPRRGLLAYMDASRRG